jgi:hypothetical protein
MEGQACKSTARRRRIPRSVFRILALVLASNASVLFVLEYGSIVWPEGLPGGAHRMFWLASGVNLALILRFGLRYCPLIVLDAFPACWISGEALDGAIIGASTNVLETLFAAWVILRVGRFKGAFDGIRPVAALIVVSAIAPLINTLIIPAYYTRTLGTLAEADFWRALANWNLANGAAILVLVPLITAAFGRAYQWKTRMKESVAVGVVALLLFSGAFGSMFFGLGMNAAFGAFPVVLYVAVRFGFAETAAVLGLMLAVIYVTAAVHAQAQDPSAMAATIWFTQAFVWVLAATGLLVTALSAERRQAESRSLQAIVGEERARLSALRYQINPHFLFNTLNSIRAATPLSEQVPREMITDLADYLRSSLTQNEVERVTLAQEFESALTYLAIERRRFGDRLRVKVELPASAKNLLVPAFLLQPLVENAIRHGLEEMKEPCLITLRAEVNQRLHIEVSNAGSWKGDKRPQGIGLQNIRRRLELIYANEAWMEIERDINSVRVILNLPI